MELAQAGAVLRNEMFPNPDIDYVWIHIGDDLALDVAGAATCGAKTILAELADKQYEQTARYRFDYIDDSDKIPGWNVSPIKELKIRRQMNEAAVDLVDKKVAFISHIPEAIREILDNEQGRDVEMLQ